MMKHVKKKIDKAWLEYAKNPDKVLPAECVKGGKHQVSLLKIGAELVTAKCDKCNRLFNFYAWV